MEITASERSRRTQLPDAGPLLRVADISVSFGGIHALQGISFDVAKGQIVGVIGPNGAGKTTLFNCVSRLYTPSGGDILLNDRTLLSEPAHRMPNRGLARTFQNVALFRQMTVLENIMVGGHAQGAGNILADACRLPASRREHRRLVEKAWHCADNLDLAGIAGKTVADLPFGSQKRVELARALAGDPTLLLLDEPAGGLNHAEVDEFGALIARIRSEWKLTVLIVEHHMGLVMSLSDRIVALNFGRKLAEGTPAEIQKNEAVAVAYLGTGKK